MRDVRSSVASTHYYLGAAQSISTFRNFATCEQCGQAQWPTAETSHAVLWPFIALVWSALASRTRSWYDSGRRGPAIPKGHDPALSTA
jgi:hypothetical protein